jgi:hypothetical protein
VRGNDTTAHEERAPWSRSWRPKARDGEGLCKGSGNFRTKLATLAFRRVRPGSLEEIVASWSDLRLAGPCDPTGVGEWGLARSQLPWHPLGPRGLPSQLEKWHGGRVRLGGLHWP